MNQKNTLSKIEIMDTFSVEVYEAIQKTYKELVNIGIKPWAAIIEIAREMDDGSNALMEKFEVVI